MGEPAAPRLTLAPRHPLPQARFHLYGALAATVLGVVAGVAALSLRALPPTSFSVVLFATAPLAAVVALVLVASRARAERDLPLLWVSVGLSLAVLAMVLQLVSFPTVTAHGGPLGTSGHASAALYLAFHATFALGVLAGALRLPRRGLLPALAAGVVVLVLLAADLLPLPPLLTPTQAFTSTLVGLEWALVALTVLALVAWAATEGPVSTPARGWTGVALALAAGDVVLNALAGQRYDALWWSSLTLRATTFVVLAGGVLAALLVQIGRFEAYTASELDRRESELASSLRVSDRLLENARTLAAAVDRTQVVDALTAAAAAVAALPRVIVFGVDRQTQALTLLGTRGYDAASAAALQRLSLQGLPANDVVRTGTAVFVSGHDELIRRFPAMTGVAVHATRTQCLAAVPMTVAGDVVGVLAVTGDRPQAWEPDARELLAGLADQGGQALLRAAQHEFEHSAAEVLQRALLPRVLPVRGDLTLAARYLPGAEGVQVGGDWYDAIPCGRRLALVVGDVVGMGLDAATVMGQLRTSVRVLAALDPSPAAVLTGLDRVVDRLGADGVFATLLYLLLDPDTDEATLVRAGHMPLLVAHPGREPVLVTDGGSLPLGTPPGPRREVAVRLPPGSAVLLFSDGLVECHPGGLGAGLEHLRSTVAAQLAHAAPCAERLADAILASSPPDRPDDVALLVMVRSGA